MISKKIDADFSKISNNINNTTRFLLEGNMEMIANCPLMQTQICVGIPVQCIDVLFDTGTPYLVISDYVNMGIKFVTNFYNSSKSETLSDASEIQLRVQSKTSTIIGSEVKDKVSITPKNNMPYLFSFLLSRNIFEYYIGILGLGHYYPKLDNENSFDERFSFVHYLKRNKIISKLIFGYEYTDRIHGNIYFGEEPKSMRNGYFKCKVQNFISFSNKWHCNLLSAYINNGKNYTILSSTVAFSTGQYNIYGPYNQVSKFIDIIKKIGGEKCRINQIEFNEKKWLRIYCDLDINISDFPDISFDIVGFKMTLLKRDLFRKEKINGSKIGYISTLHGSNEYNYWDFGEPILKNYDMVFNYEDNTVGFKANNNYYGGDWLGVIILFIVLICCIFIAIYIIKNRKTIFNKKFKEEDMKKLKIENNLKETLEMKEL